MDKVISKRRGLGMYAKTRRRNWEAIMHKGWKSIIDPGTNEVNIQWKIRYNKAVIKVTR